MARIDDPTACTACGYVFVAGDPFFWRLPYPPERPERLALCVPCWRGAQGRQWDAPHHAVQPREVTA